MFNHKCNDRRKSWGVREGDKQCAMRYIPICSVKLGTCGVKGKGAISLGLSTIERMRKENLLVSDADFGSVGGFK